MISQTAHFPGVTPERLYAAFLTAADHAAMTGNGTAQVTFEHPDGTPTDTPAAGDRLLAFGSPNPDGTISYRLTATLLDLVSSERIVMSWRTAAWEAATSPAEADPQGTSIVVLHFVANPAGAEIRLDQSGVPGFTVHLPDTGERGPLEAIVNTHWNLLYWEPMRRLFGRTDGTAA
jgi:hypothetical protein